MKVNRSGGILHTSERLVTLCSEWHSSVIQIATSHRRGSTFSVPTCVPKFSSMCGGKEGPGSISPPGLGSALCSVPLWVQFSLLPKPCLLEDWRRLDQTLLLLNVPLLPLLQAHLLWCCTEPPEGVHSWVKWGWGGEEGPENLVTPPLLPHSVAPKAIPESLRNTRSSTHLSDSCWDLLGLKFTGTRATWLGHWCHPKQQS